MSESKNHPLKINGDVMQKLTENQKWLERRCRQPLTEEEVSEYRDYLITDCGVEEEYIEMIEEVYSQIVDGIYDIISLIEGDKRVINWIRYGYEVDFEKQSK